MNQDSLRYSMLIQWSNEDAAFLVTLPEWHGRVFNPVAHGESYEEAVQNGQIALEQLVSVTLERGQELPVVSGSAIAEKVVARMTSATRLTIPD